MLPRELDNIKEDFESGGLTQDFLRRMIRMETGRNNEDHPCPNLNTAYRISAYNFMIPMIINSYHEISKLIKAIVYPTIKYQPFLFRFPFPHFALK